MKRCLDCRQVKVLTKHSLLGGHKSPFIFICRTCHDLRHDTTQRPRTAERMNRKIKKGTRYGRSKRNK